ncbi:hypothetical protein L829_1436 [Mycobacteroides abscessus MAB_030201_1075]|uniref:Uncharacterized protein n=2 Tax=Mycobacteroides abscessus TaxID=36809 RepID=A0A829PLK2_9MYCO|nr:hypothetical protein MA4S0726RA_1814 [Mycobacteroides abscessus 4S-0726-RA]EIU00616.1 hypothetical protein MA4S0303_1105 [Mycobacteroides abscessus 4S-0303]EIU01618.1 hypothetical protein MA4S0726RB_0218 [Mycobacteroides abscessus 4S-0726-RB]EIU56022.1 hypothetical protein MA6G0728S_1040 [Mycobacteroides abscessus 6G-0728-S]EIV15345.1 hypothetical protein MA4S0206_0043 [Mycobacteroides abscessus 4S-0206]EIV21130.1 hypothetical protein MA3A0119R_4084 [Mycobacteroides abscessus 3A-0119-R]EIV
MDWPESQRRAVGHQLKTPLGGQSLDLDNYVHRMKTPV